PDKVTGRAKYTSDIVLPGICYGRFLTSRHGAARLAAIDASPAQRMPGVKAVKVLKTAGTDLPFSGIPIAAVAAVTPEIAEDAIRALQVTYEPRPFVVDLERAMAPNAPIAIPERKGN